MNFQDAIREGDGDRVFILWKYLLIIFKATGRKNYALEAFTILAQHKWFLPPRLSKQLQFSRFVNVHGRPGCNVPFDLYMEHLNKIAKQCVQHLGANKTPTSFQRIGKCVGQVDEILACYDADNHVSSPSIHHSVPPSIDDRDHIIKELLQCKVFTIEPGRQHRNFQKFSSNVMKKVNKKSVTEWMKMHIKKMTDLVAMQS